MSDVIDIQEVMHKAAEDQLQLISLKNKNPSRLVAHVIQLEKCAGNLEHFLVENFPKGHHAYALFDIENTLAAPENKELRQRWNSALRLNTKMRMDLLRSKALDMLESYQNLSSTSSATDIAYCKTLLGGFLTEETAAARAKYYNRISSDNNGLTNEDSDELENLRDQL